MIYKNFFILNQ